MDIPRTYISPGHMYGYAWKGDTLVKNPSKKVTRISRIKTSPDYEARIKSGGFLGVKNLDLDAISPSEMNDSTWYEFIKILDPIFDRGIYPDHLIETITEGSDLYDEQVKEEVKNAIFSFVHAYGFDDDMKVWTDDIGTRLEPTVQNICMEAFMLYLGVAMNQDQILEDGAYAEKVNQANLKLHLTDSGYEINIMGFWDSIWRGFSLDPKRGNAKTCKRCSKPFIAKNTKRKHCGDVCKWNEWNDRQKAEKSGEKK